GLQLLHRPQALGDGGRADRAGAWLRYGDPRRHRRGRPRRLRPGPVRQLHPDGGRLHPLTGLRRRPGWGVDLNWQPLAFGAKSSPDRGGVAMAQYPAVVQLSDLDGTDGFRIDGADFSSSFPGFSDWARVAAAGDVNGDGFDDLVVGNPLENPNGY